MSSRIFVQLSVGFIVFLSLVKGTFAQGFLGRMKQGVLDVAKETVNEAAPQTLPQDGAVDEKPRAAGNGTFQETEGKRKTAAEAEREATRAQQEEEREAARAKREAEAEEAKAREAKWKEDAAKQEEEREAARAKQEEDDAKWEAERVAKEAKQKTEAQEKILNELRAGKITAKNAKDRLQQNRLWQDELEQKLDTIVAERMAELEKNKFPLADTFKTPVSMYKEFESGMSKEWCEAKLTAEDALGLVNTSSINLKTKEGAGKVILLFENLIPEKPSVLTACVIELAPSIRHTDVLGKYKKELPDATVKHEAKPIDMPKGGTYLMDGISLDMQVSVTRQTDVLTSASKTVTVESNLPVGKVFLVYHNSNRKIAICEISKDGTVTVPNGLDARQKESADMVKDQMLAGIQKVTVLVEDNAMAKALKNLQKAEQENEKKKQQQKDADALAF